MILGHEPPAHVAGLLDASFIPSRIAFALLAVTISGAASQLVLLVAFILFLLCLPVRLVLQLCCGVKLQPPPGHYPQPGAANDLDVDEDDRDVVINIPPETAAPDQVSA